MLKIGTKVKVIIPAFQHIFGENQIWIISNYNYQVKGKVRYGCHKENSTIIYNFFPNEIVTA